MDNEQIDGPNFDHRHYVPCLRWKQGEYQALFRLADNTKRRITPLIEVAEIGWDFERGELAKTIDEHLVEFAERVRKKWGGPLAFVDLKQIAQDDRMRNGAHPLKYVFDDLRVNGAPAIPVTGLKRDKPYQQAVADTISLDGMGACVRLTLLDVSSSQFPKSLSSLLDSIELQPENIDLILDLEAPTFEPLDGFTKMVTGIIRRLPALDKWRTYTICGTSFPESMGNATIEMGAQRLKRYEWLFYKLLRKQLGDKDRKPTFGDYGIAHPKVFRVDMRKVKPYATIRYTADDAWYIVKGPNVRDNGNEQYRKHCKTLISSGYFTGGRYSAGDKHIVDCAQGVVSPGGLTTWRWVGTNHHLEKVATDIANLRDT